MWQTISGSINVHLLSAYCTPAPTRSLLHTSCSSEFQYHFVRFSIQKVDFTWRSGQRCRGSPQTPTLRSRRECLGESLSRRLRPRTRIINHRPTVPMAISFPDARTATLTSTATASSISGHGTVHYVELSMASPLKPSPDIPTLSPALR